MVVVDVFYRASLRISASSAGRTADGGAQLTRNSRYCRAPRGRKDVFSTMQSGVAGELFAGALLFVARKRGFKFFTEKISPQFLG